MITRPSNLPPAAMSIDIEDWFQVENLRSAIPRDSWDDQESRVVHNTELMLEIMAARDIRCTCFILGWVADRQPELVKRIAAAGHEIASHGYGHDLIYNLSEDDFRTDVDTTKKMLEDLTGQQVRGYRAPSFSITDWAIPILRETGHEYDSSAFPTVAHDRYGKLTGMQAGQPIVRLLDDFSEVCISCVQLGKRGVPWGGGGYFRLFPYSIFKRGVKRILRSGMPYVFYIHPWELDAGQPRVEGLKRSYAFRHYVNVDKCQARWSKLLDDFQWTTVADVLDRCRPSL